MTFFQTYFKATSIAAGSKIFAAISALGVLWLIHGLVGKDGFGLIMIGYALALVLANALGGFFYNIMFYHTARDYDDARVQSALGIGILSAAALGTMLSFVAQPIAILMNKPELVGVLSAFGLMIPAFAANYILTGWYRARHDVPTMVIFFEVLPLCVRLALLAGLLSIGSVSLEMIAWVFAASYAIPFVILWAVRPVRLSLNAAFSSWDLRYGLSSMGAQLLNKSALNIMVFVLGFFSGAGAVAEFALASRFAAFLNLPQLAIEQLQLPRMGLYLKNKQHDLLVREFHQARLWGLGLCVLAIMIGALVLPIIVPFFGTYSLIMNLFFILGIGIFIRSAFGPLSGVLTMSGHAGINMMMNGLSIIVMLGVFVLFDDKLAGAALGMSAGAAMASLGSYYALRRVIKLP